MGAGDVCTGFWWGNLRERGPLEDVGIERNTILKWIFKKWFGGVVCIDLAQDRDTWQAVLNAAMNLRVP